MADELKGKTAAILAADRVEKVELTDPKEAVGATGARTELLTLSDGESRR